jgi:hypothetical protein
MARLLWYDALSISSPEEPSLTLTHPGQTIHDKLASNFSLLTIPDLTDGSKTVLEKSRQI